jgi:hypothetical protein
MFKRLTLIGAAVLLSVLGLASPAFAGDGATVGTWTTNQTVGSHDFTYDYEVTVRDSTRKWFELKSATHCGPSGTNWQLLVNTATGPTTYSLSLAGNGFGGAIKSSVGSGCTTINLGDAGTSNWGKVSMLFSAGETDGRKMITKIGNPASSSSPFDLSSGNVPPPPPTDISGTGFSMDFTCTSPANTAYASHWTAYYDIAGTNPNWTATFTNLVRNSETGTPLTVDLSLAGNGHIVTTDVVPFSWASGTLPTISLAVNWGGGISCSDDRTLIVGP